MMLSMSVSTVELERVQVDHPEQNIYSTYARSSANRRRRLSLVFCLFFLFLSCLAVNNTIRLSPIHEFNAQKPIRHSLGE
jgi:hypothetical protein